MGFGQLLAEQWGQDPEFAQLPDEVKRAVVLNFFDREVADEGFGQLEPEKQGQVKANYLEDFGLSVSEQEPGFFESVARGAAHGTLGLAKSVGNITRWAGAKLGSETIKNAGQVAADFWENEQTHFERPESWGSLWDNPGLLKKGTYWGYSVADMLPSFASAAVPAVGAHKYIKIGGQLVKLTPKVVERLAALGAGITGGAVGGALEGSETYSTVLKQGGTEEDAQAAGETMALAAAGLNAIPLGKMVSPSSSGRLVRFLTTGAAEAVTEWAEEPTEAAILGEDIEEAMRQGVEVIPASFLLGGGAQTLFDRGRREAGPPDGGPEAMEEILFEEPVPPGPPQEGPPGPQTLQQRMQQEIDREMGAGLPGRTPQERQAIIDVETMGQPQMPQPTERQRPGPGQAMLDAARAEKQRAGEWTKISGQPGSAQDVLEASGIMEPEGPKAPEQGGPPVAQGVRQELESVTQPLSEEELRARGGFNEDQARQIAEGEAALLNQAVRAIEEVRAEPPTALDTFRQKIQEQKRPNTFVSFIRSIGGLNDPSLPGEMAEYGFGRSRVGGLENKKTGRTFDEVARLAVEDGWLPEGATGDDFRALLDQGLLHRRVPERRAVRLEQMGAPIEAQAPPMSAMQEQQQRLMQEDQPAEAAESDYIFQLERELEDAKRQVEAYEKGPGDRAVQDSLTEQVLDGVAAEEGLSREEVDAALTDFDAFAESQRRKANYAGFMDQLGYRLQSEAKGQEILDNMERENIRPTDANNRFWAETYPQLTDKQRSYVNNYVRRLTSMQPGDTIATDREGKTEKASDWADIATNMIDLGASVDTLEGPVRGYVSIIQTANEAIGAPQEPAFQLTPPEQKAPKAPEETEAGRERRELEAQGQQTIGQIEGKQGQFKVPPPAFGKGKRGGGITEQPGLLEAEKQPALAQEVLAEWDRMVVAEKPAVAAIEKQFKEAIDQAVDIAAKNAYSFKFADPGKGRVVTERGIKLGDYDAIWGEYGLIKTIKKDVLSRAKNSKEHRELWGKFDALSDYATSRIEKKLGHKLSFDPEASINDRSPGIDKALRGWEETLKTQEPTLREVGSTKDGERLYNVTGGKEHGRTVTEAQAKKQGTEIPGEKERLRDEFLEKKAEELFPDEFPPTIREANAEKGDILKATARKALRTGKPVPSEVLADYPELTKKGTAKPVNPYAGLSREEMAKESLRREKGKKVAEDLQVASAELESIKPSKMFQQLLGKRKQEVKKEPVPLPTKPLGRVWHRNMWQPYVSQRDVLKGKSKGKIEVTFKDGKKAIVEASAIRSIQVEQVIKKIKDQKGSSEVINDLSKIGADLIRKGAKTFKDFTAQMRTTLGEAFETVRNIMLKVYNGAKKILANERGAINLDGLFNRAKKTTPTEARENVTARPKSRWWEKEWFGPTDKSAFEKTKQGFKVIKKSFKTEVYDRFQPMKLLGEKVYKMGRMSTMPWQTFATFLQHGRLKWNGELMDIQEKDKGFAKILEWLGKEAHDGAKWVLAKRSEDIEAANLKRSAEEQLKPPLSKEQREIIYRDIGQPTKLKSWEEFNAIVQHYNKNILDIAQEAGNINPETRKYWEQQHYMPAHRIWEDPKTNEQFQAALKKDPKNIDKLVWRFVGSDKKLGDPLENLVKNWAHIISESQRNKVMQEAHIAATDMGIAKEVQWKDLKTFYTPKSKAEGGERVVYVTDKGDQNVLSFFRDGKRVYSQVEDMELFHALTNLNPKKFTHWAMLALQAPKRLLTLGATITPAFRVANTLRDTLHTWMIFPTVKGPTGQKVRFIPFLDSAIGAVKAWKRDADYISSAAGTAQFGGSYLHAQDPRSMQRHIDRLVKKEGKGVRGAIIDTPKKLWDVWQKIGEVSEGAARTQLYAKMRRAGFSHFESSFEARDVLDFSKSGKSGAVQAMISMYPFLNARMQGLARMAEGAARNPLNFTVKGLAYTMASLALWNAFRDEDWYKEREDWDRRTYHAFRLPGLDVTFRLPKPFETGAIFGTLFEAAAEGLVGDRDFDDFMDMLGGIVRDVFEFNVYPQTFRPLVEQAQNKTFFTGRKIESERLQDLIPGERAEPWTSSTLKLLGRKTGVSPERMDALFKGYFAGIATLMLGVTDLMIDQTDALPVKPPKRIDDYPLVGRFVKQKHPARYTRYDTKFYEFFQEANELIRTVKNMAGMQGRVEEARKIATDNKLKLQMQPRLGKAKRATADIAKAIRATVDHPMWDAKTKERKIDKLLEAKNAIRKQVVQEYQRALREQ